MESAIRKPRLTLTELAEWEKSQLPFKDRLTIDGEFEEGRSPAVGRVILGD